MIVRSLERCDVGVAGRACGSEIRATPGETLAAELSDQNVGGETHVMECRQVTVLRRLLATPRSKRIARELLRGRGAEWRARAIILNAPF